MSPALKLTFRCLAALFASAALAAPVTRSASEAGSTYIGPTAGIDFARPVTAADLDGDGYDDLVTSASESWGGVFSHVYIVRGGPAAHGRGLRNLAAAPPDQVIVGAQLDDNLGASLAAGDVNGDAVADLLLCASLADYGGLADRGLAYVIYGNANFFAEPVRDLALDSNWDIRIFGPVAGGDMGGANAFGGLDAQGAAIGRLNDDGYGDIALGVHLADAAYSDCGRAYIVFGGPYPSGSWFNLATPGMYHVRIDGRYRYDELGTVVRAADLTGDGLDELILGVEYASRGLFTSDGAVYILRGRANWPASWPLLSTPADLTLLGWRDWDNLGASVAAGDFNGDGLADLAAAAPGAELGVHDTQWGDGLVYGLLGSPAYQTGTHTIDYASAAPAFLLVGDPDENLGALVTTGDFNGDGRADLAAGEWFGGPATNGLVEILYGRDFVAAPGDPYPIYTAGVDTDLRLLGAANDRISFSLGCADTNGDGLIEIVFGTPFNYSDRGSVYVFTHVAADPDHDGDTDLRDFAGFQACFAPQPGADPRGLTAPCVHFDFDFDELVAGSDLAPFATAYTGPR